MIKLSTEDRRLIGLLLKPSWISGLVAVVLGLTVSIGVVVAFEANSSLLQQHLLAWQQNTPQPALTTPSQTVPENGRPTIQDSWPLLLLWSLAGLVVYVIAASIVHSIGQAEELRESLDYVNAKPRAALASTAEHALLRIIAGVLLIVFLVAFWRQIIPYSITAAHACEADVLSLDGGLYALLSFSLIAVGVQVLTVLLRLALGRPRVFREM